ncbi:MAG: PxKF domain-containing protein [Gaiellaceae bacterium]
MGAVVFMPAGLSATGGGTCIVSPIVRDSGVNQGVSGTAGYTPLVRGKDTVVRFYLSGPNCGTATFQLTSASLQLKNGTSNIGQAVPADPAPITLSGNNPAIATYSTAAVSNDTPGDAKFLVPGYQMNPCGGPACTNSARFTATFAASLGWRASTGATGTLNATVNADVDQKSNALRILVVKMGDLSNATGYTANQFPLFGADAQTTLQNAISGTLARAFPVPSAPDANSPPVSDLTRALGGIRYSFNITANCGGLSPTCGMLDLARLTDTASPPVPLLGPTHPFCLNGTTFGIIQPQLTNMLNAWNAANPGSQADRVLGVVDGSVSDQTCALGMAGFGTPQAVVRVDPGRNNNGATLVMEMAHTLGAVPAARSNTTSRYHSPAAEADTGLATADPNAGTNRSYNTATRTYLSTDRTAMRVVDTNWTDNNVDFEAKDFSLLRCMLGGSVPTDTTIGCTASGNTGTGTSVAADSLYVAGSLAAPNAAQAKVTESYLQVNAGTIPAPSVGTDNASKYYVVERNGATLTKQTELPVSCDTSLHDDGGGTANTNECYFDAAVAFSSGATSFEIWRGAPSGVCTAAGDPQNCLYVRRASTAPPTTTVTPGGGGGGTGVGVQTAWMHDTLNKQTELQATPHGINSLDAVTNADGNGNVYAAGYVTDCTNAGCTKDAVVEKVSPTGQVAWVSQPFAGDGGTTAGDNSDDVATGVAFGPDGVYVSGTRSSGCNPVDPRCPPGGQIAFVAGFTTDGNQKLFAKTIDSPGKSTANAIVYANSMLYVAGGAQGTNTVNPTIEAPTAFSGRLWKISPTDGTVVDARVSAVGLGWTGVTDAGNAIWVTGSNVDAAVARYTDSGTLGAHPDFISHFGSTPTSNCSVTQDYSSSGAASSITFANESGVDVRIFWLGFDGNLEQYPTGFANNILPTSKSYTQSTFITHPWVAIAPDGRCIGYTISDAASKTYTIQAPQGTSETTGGIAHAGSSVYVTGHTTGQIEGQSGSAFVSQLDDAGDGMLWTRQFASNTDLGEAVAANNFGVYAVGSTFGSIGNAQNLGSSDAFLIHYSPAGNFLYATQFPTAAVDRGHGVSVDGESGDIFAVGDAQAQIGTDTFSGSGGQDGFTGRFNEVTQDGTGGGTATVTSAWPTAADATNARLDVYYKCPLDGGGEITSYVNYPVALGLTPTTNGTSAVFTVPNSTTVGCPGGTMSFFENNGFSKVDVTPPTPVAITAANTAPVASISTPTEGSHWLQYQTIPASGDGKDAEVGALTGSSLSWALAGPSGPKSGSGNTPTFGGPPNGLAPGAYTLTLSASDGSTPSLTGTATVHFTVDADANNDWIPGTVSCVSDSTFNVAFGDADGDHIPNIDDAQPCQRNTPADTTPPTITVTHVTATNTNNTNGTITFTVRAADAGSGLRSVFCTVDGNPAVGLKDATWAAPTFSDTFTEPAAGAHAVVCTAADLAYNTATASDGVYDFVGFLPPVNNPTTVNTGKAGRTYPVKWQLLGPTGASLGTSNLVTDVKFKAVTCGGFSNDPTDALETTATGATTLRFDGSQWIYNWATPSTKGCYSLFVLLNDGSTRTAYFNLS